MWERLQRFTPIYCCKRVPAFLIGDIVLQIDSNDPLEQNLRHPKLQLLIILTFPAHTRLFLGFLPVSGVLIQSAISPRQGRPYIQSQLL